MNDAFSLGLRGEYFAEFNGGVDAIGALDAEGDGSVFAATLTGSYTPVSYTHLTLPTIYSV